jgi:TRAP-type transport system small permease protein
LKDARPGALIAQTFDLLRRGPMLRFVEIVTALTRAVVVVLGGVLVVVVFGEVVSRYMLNRSLIFADELARYLFIWAAFLGASLALRQGQHIGLELRVHQRSRSLKLFAHVCSGAFLLVFLVTSLALLPDTWDQHATTLEIRMFWVFLALPVSAALMLLQLAVLVQRSFRGDTGGASAHDQARVGL